MLPVQSCFHCQFQCHVLIALVFYQNSLKIKLFLQKNAKISSAEFTAPRPPCLQRLGALPPDPLPPLTGSFAPRPPKQPPKCEFLDTPLLSVLVCYARILPISIRTAFSNITYICHNIPQQERLFSSCTYQKRKHEIKENLKMM